MTFPSTSELCDQAVGDVEVISRAWAASRGNHHDQAVVAAAALEHFLHLMPQLLVLINAEPSEAAAEPVGQLP